MRFVGGTAGAALFGVLALATGWFITAEPRATFLAVIGAVLVAALVRTWLAARSLEAEATGVIAWPAVLLPTALAIRWQWSDVATVAALCLLIALALLRPGATHRLRPAPLVLVGVAIAVPLLQGPATQLVLAGLVSVLVVAIARRYGWRDSTRGLLDGVGLYLIANVVAYAAGLRSPYAGLRTGGLEAAGGGERILYPLTASLSLPAAMAAIFLASSLLLFERGGVRRVFRVAAAFCAVTVLLGTDSRTALAVSVLIAGLTLLGPRVVRVIAIPLAVGSLLFAFLFVLLPASVTGPVVSGALDLADTSQRAGESSDASLNGRSFVWEQSIDYWETLESRRDRLTGFGPQGQIDSGASATYASLFEEAFQDARAATTHNSGLQQLYDGGLLGLGALVAAAVASLFLWTRRRGVVATSGLAAALAAVLNGTTEVSLVPGYLQESFFVFVALVVFSAVRSADPEAGTDPAVDAKTEALSDGGRSPVAGSTPTGT